jgi:hypothetical protein
MEKNKKSNNTICPNKIICDKTMVDLLHPSCYDKRFFMKK